MLGEPIILCYRSDSFLERHSRFGIKMADRMRVILHHIEPSHSPAMHAFGIQNPIKAVGFKSNYSETRKPSLPQFKYTKANAKLSINQRNFYEKNGFLVISNLVPLDCLERLKLRFQEICENSSKFPALTVMKDISYVKQDTNENTINKIQDFVFDDVLFEYCVLPEILDIVECFCGPNIKAVHTMLINKPPDSGSLSSRHPLHQDLQYFPFRPADKIVCSWTAMERANRENGCLVVIPGSHRGELHQHTYPNWEGGVNKLYHGLSELKPDDIAQRAYLEMNAGDTVFFHPLLIHGSGANRTDGFRKAICCHYAASECYYIDVNNTSQKNISDEILEVARKRGVNLDDVKYIWQIRSRLVRGIEVSL